jgi:type IV pilus assembly protein PilM
MTKAISESMSIDVSKAYEIKHDDEKAQENVFEAMKPVLFELVSEIRLSFSYYENQFGRSVDGVFITGGSAKFAKLETFLTENLGLETKRWDPLANIKVSEKIDGKELDILKNQVAVSIGLALRG